MKGVMEQQIDTLTQCLARLEREVSRYRQANWRLRRHGPISRQGAWLKSVLLGHYRYDAIPSNDSLRVVCHDTILR